MNRKELMETTLAITGKPNVNKDIFKFHKLCNAEGLGELKIDGLNYEAVRVGTKKNGNWFLTGNYTQA